MPNRQLDPEHKILVIFESNTAIAIDENKF